MVGFIDPVGTSFQSATKSVPSTTCFGMTSGNSNSYCTVGAESVYSKVFSPTVVDTMSS